MMKIEKRTGCDWHYRFVDPDDDTGEVLEGIVFGLGAQVNMDTIRRDASLPEYCDIILLVRSDFINEVK